MTPRRRLAVALCAGCALVALPPRLGAQASGALVVGTGTTSLGGATGTGFLSLAPELMLGSGRFTLEASGTYADHLRPGWRSRARGTTTVGVDLGRGFLAEAEAEGGWSELTWGGTRGGWLGGARLGFESGPHRVTFGAGVGRNLIRGEVQPLTRLEARGRSRVAGLRVGWLLSRTAVRSPGSTATAEPLLGLDTLVLAPVNGERFLQDHYTDASVSLGWDRRRLGIEAGLGHRFAKPVARYTHWHLRGAFQLVEGLALVGAAGRYPYDVVSGLPRGSFATLGVRMTVGRERRAARPATIEPAVSLLPRVRRPFALTPLGEDHYLAAVYAPGARSVELMGSFTDWTPVSLEPREDGRWVWGFPIAPGVHHFNVRLDGGPWSVPAGVRTLPGEFGTVGVVVVTGELTP